MTFEEYQKQPGINASFLKACLGGAYDGFKYLTEPKAPSDAMDFGSAVHTMILEPHLFPERVAVSQKFDRRTKQGKADAEAFEALHAGKIIIDEIQRNKIAKIAQKCKQIEIVREALETFEKEKTVVMGGFKGRLDLYGNDSVIDVKTTRSANERDFIRDTVNLGYDVQLLHYAKLTSAAHVYAIAIETDTCEVACYDMADIVFSDFTKDRYERALATARHVLTLKECPLKFKPEIVTLKLPAWAKSDVV